MIDAQIASGVDNGGHRMVPVMAFALLLLQTTTHSPAVTVAITVSGISLAGVATLLFKAGEWRGEHRALQKEVATATTGLSKQMTDGFARLERDVRELRKQGEGN